jgi:hypothetical protein
VTGELLTLPRLFRPVRRRPYQQVSGLQPSAAVQAERRQFKRLAVNLAVSQQRSHCPQGRSRAITCGS